jgi:hypothetical protein
MSDLSDSENEVHIVGESWNVGCVRLSFLRNSENARTRSHSFPQSSATLLANKGEDLLGLKRHGSWKVQLKTTLKIVLKTRFNLQKKFFMALK